MKSFTKYVARQFRNPSGLGGLFATKIMNNMNWRQYNVVLDTLKDVLSGEKVLDVGFGNGQLIKKLAEKSDAIFYGIDISQDILKKAITVNQHHIKSGKVHLSLGNIMDLKFPSDCFDIIYTVNTIYFWDDIRKGLKEIDRVLKPGGVFLNVAYTKQWLDKLSYTSFGFSKYEIAELKELIEEAGLEVSLIKELKKNKSYSMIIKKKSQAR